MKREMKKRQRYKPHSGGTTGDVRGSGVGDGERRTHTREEGDRVLVVAHGLLGGADG